MAVGFRVKHYWYSVGTGDLLHAFFSTVAVNLEKGVWGKKYPVLMKELYQGTLQKDHLGKAISELKKVQKELKKLSPDKVVWDFEDRSKTPPWGDKISEDITDLSNYFVTSSGEDLIEVLFHALEKAKELQLDLQIQSL